MAITFVSAASIPSGVQPITVLAAAYESRATQIARLFIPLASFAGDTAQTLSDGSFNSNINSVLASSTAVLATTSNIRNVSAATNPAAYGASANLNYANQGNDVDTNGDGVVDDGDGGGVNPVTAKPLIIKVRRDPFTGEINGYGVFNADGTVPGQVHTPGTPLYTPGQQGDPFDLNMNPRYMVDRMSGQVLLYNRRGIVGVNLDSAAGGEIFSDLGYADAPAVAGPPAVPNKNIVGIVEFKALEGAALSTAQQKASELSNVIQSLATLLRGFKDSERTLINAFR